MKLIIRDYLASLREREELDAILPDLLSELGYTVLSRPSRGTKQHGVDVAAIGVDEDGERKIFLFSVKQGDLTRRDWDGPMQALRPSLNEIRDAYIPIRIPKRYSHLKIVICICLGGYVQEQVQDAIRGYIRENTSDRISFDEWNGDRIAGLLLQGVLREEILPKEVRSSFQKSVALVDEPDIAYNHFVKLIKQLRELEGRSQGTRVRIARQLYICLWILFVWARDVENVEAPYRVSELVLLNVWDLLRTLVGKRNQNKKALDRVLQQSIQLHLTIASELLERKLMPHAGRVHGISMAVNSRSAVDINLKLFEFLGRIAMTGLWVHWLASLNRVESTNEQRRHFHDWIAKGFQLINANPTLFCPLCDQHAIEVALFLMLAVTVRDSGSAAAIWLQQMVARLDFTVRTHGRYPCVFTDYRQLIVHPRERSDEYRKEATSGSILIPLLAAWLAALGDASSLEKLVELKKTILEHCTLQLWLPDSASEASMYKGERDHGISLTDLPLSMPGDELLKTISDACERESAFAQLSASRAGIWPLILVACRHHRLPIPPHFWIDLLRPQEGGGQA